MDKMALLSVLTEYKIGEIDFKQAAKEIEQISAHTILGRNLELTKRENGKISTDSYIKINRESFGQAMRTLDGYELEQLTIKATISNLTEIDILQELMSIARYCFHTSENQGK